jgi:hypothetical protein
MLEAVAPPRLRLSTDRFLLILLTAGLILVTIVIVVLLSLGRVGVSEAFVFAASLCVLLAAAFRPDWLLLGFIAMPATVTADLPVRVLLAVVAVAILMLLVTRRRFSLGLGTGLAALVAINVAGYVFKADVDREAYLLNRETMLHITLYILLGLLAFNLVTLGELDSRGLGSAFVLGVITTLLVGWAGHGGGWFESGPGIISRTYLGSLAAAAFGVVLARLLLEKESFGAARLGTLILTGTLLWLSIASFFRAAWIAVAITTVLLAFRLRRRGFLLLMAVVIALFFLAPTLQRQVIRPEQGDITTGRWKLWVELWDHAEPALPWGNGFGYMWSLSTLQLFGEEEGFRSEVSGKVPPHNDFIYMAVEFGLPGIILLSIFWLRLFSAQRLVSRSTDPELRWSALLFLGVIVTGFIVAMIDNVFSVRPIAERFFPVAGFVFGLAALERVRQRQQARRAVSSTEVLSTPP